MEYPDEPKKRIIVMPRREQAVAILILLASYIGFARLPELLGTDPLALFPGAAVALSVLFFGGIGLWPFVFLTCFVGCVLAGFSPAVCLFLPFAQAVQAALGARLLRSARVDPLFRRTRDIFWLLGVILVTSLVVPSFGLLVRTIDPSFSGTSWEHAYVGSIFSLLILVPFLLRWYAKPYFSRTWPEVAKLVMVFAALIGINQLLFVSGLTDIRGIPFVYVLLVPLFWIALRKRPRFVTLALFITALYAIAGMFLGEPIAPHLMADHLFQIQAFLILIASVFLIVTSLEENRRLNSNLANSQVAALQNAIARASSESKAKNDFIAILAHELRNPLAPIASGIDLLKLKGGRDEEDTETLSIMEGRMQVIRRLLDDLLDISRVTEGKIDIRKTPVDLDAVIRKSVLSTEHHFKERHQLFSYHAPEQPLAVIGDPVRLEQVFSNLLTNASKYSESGDAISLSVSEKHGQAEIVVEDEGLGIEPGLLEHIFMPFHQADNGQRSRKGLGIGLALVRSFVEIHGGEVAAHSRGLGHGSRFTVILPLTRSAGVDLPEPASKLLAPKPNAGLSILVVDDNDAAAWGVGRLLELRGCSVEYAYDGKRAVDLAKRLNPDIVILDLDLPDTDGYSVAKTIRARGYRGRLMALSGFSTDDARERVREAGFERYFVKPAGIAELMKAIPELA